MYKNVLKYNEEHVFADESGSKSRFTQSGRSLGRVSLTKAITVDKTRFSSTIRDERAESRG